MSRGIRILVPTSERKRSGGSAAFTFAEAQEDAALNRFPSLSDDKAQVFGAFLAAINGQGHAADVLRLEGERLDEVVQLNLDARHGPLRAVHERDVGPLFSSLDAEALDGSARRHLRNRLLVICPLLGVLSPMDWVPHYRCPLGAKIPGLGSLHAYWKPRVTTTLNRLCKGQEVVSFLPKRLEALWDPSKRVAPMIQVNFMRRREDGKLISEHAGGRRVAGEMIHWMLREDIQDPTELRGFRATTGFVHDPSLDEECEGLRQWTFVR